MTHSAPSYLKLHRGDDLKSESPQKSSSSDQFWNAFSDATGWRVDRRHESEAVEILPAINVDLMGDDPESCQPPVVKEDAKHLAGLAVEMSREIESLRSAVKRQEIELAAHAATQIAPQRANSTAELVETTLQLAIEAGGFDSAAIYLLDDDTQYLHTRAVVGLPEERLRDQPRMLRGSRGDLEALVQKAVLIDDLTGVMGETWNAPEEAGAAVCTALFKGDLPIGTLWLFSDRPRRLDQSHSAVAKMTSSQLSLQLAEASRARKETSLRRTNNIIRDFASWQFASLPIGNRIATGWFVDGMIESPSELAIGWHAWDILPDGSIMIALAEAVEKESGALVAAIARSALSAHCGYRHSPHQLLQRISDTLWQTSSTDQLVSMLYARVDPDTGEGEVAASGSISSIIASRYGHRPLIQPGTQPLASAMDLDCVRTTFNLNAGETLLAYGDGLQQDGIGQDLLGCCLRTASQPQDGSSRGSALTVLRREMAAFPNRHERGLLALTRRDVPKP